MPTVQLPNGKTAAFPDSMTPAQIQAAIEADPAQQAAIAAANPFGSSLAHPNPASTPVAKDGTASIGSIPDTISNVGTHLKNVIAAPYHAFTDAPRNPEEAKEMGTTPDSGVTARTLGHIGLGAARMFVNPTRDAIAAIPTSQNATDVMNHVTDAIPIAGPWARSIENDAHMKGIIPALAGAATDYYAPQVIGPALAAGARGVGEALQFGVADPASRNLALTRMLTIGNPGELLQSALKPGVKYGAGVAQQLEQAIPAVTAANPNLQGVSGFAQAADAAREAAFQPYNNLLAPYRIPAPSDPLTGEALPGVAAGPFRPSAISGAPIADAQVASVPFMDTVDNPGTPTWNSWRGAFDTKGGTMGRVSDTADNYRRDFSAPQLDALRSDANAKLNAFYNKQGGDQAAALSNPETARIKAVGDATRGQLYPFLEQNAGLQPGSIADMQQNYGNLVDVSDIANKREPIFARHDPVTLSQKIVSGHGNPASMAWNYFVQNKLGQLTDSDALVNSAIDRFNNPLDTPLIAKPGLAPKVVSAAGGALRAVPKRVPLLANPFFLAPKPQQ